MTETYTLVLVRHGESEWNKTGLFTGWYDCDLSPAGFEEAKGAGKALKQAGKFSKLSLLPSTHTQEKFQYLNGMLFFLTIFFFSI